MYLSVFERISRMSDNRFELVSHPKISYLRINVVRLLSVSTHVHKETEIGIILEGSVTIRDKKETYDLQSGDSYLINSMESHELYSTDSCLILVIQIAPEFFRVFENDIESMYFSRHALREQFIDDPVSYSILKRICYDLSYEYLNSNYGDYYRCFTLTSILSSFLRDNIEHSFLDRNSYNSVKLNADRILRVLDYIDSNYTRKLLLEEIAQQEGLTLNYLSHLFKSSLGVSFQEYLKEKRFEYARNLVAGTEMNMIDISVSSGFSDVRFLNSLFQKHTSCTPTEYRAKLKEEIQQHHIPPVVEQGAYSDEEALALLTKLRGKNNLFQRMYRMFADESQE